MKIIQKMGFCLGLVMALGILSAKAQSNDTSVRARIYAAASSGNIWELQRLQSLGYSLDLTDENGNTAYCQAVWSQNRMAVATLIRAGADVRPRCLRRIPYVTESRIYAAAHAEDLDQLIAWKKEGLNVDVVNPKTGNSALCEAVYNYDCPAIQTLLRAGSQQAQPCMRRVPQEVRENLQCRPLKIDWKTIGYTVLGAGMAGALVAILGSSGGNGTPSCAATQRWDGDKCIDCDTCWQGNTCISKAEMAAKPYYPDDTTAECWIVSPPPISDENTEAFNAAVEQIKTEKAGGYGVEIYSKGGYLPSINAAQAYARGYTGYMVERTSPYGRPSNGTINTPTISNKKVTVAIYSTGMTIGQGGTMTSTDTSSGSASSKSVSVWDWNNVNKAFYKSSDLSGTSQTYTAAKSSSSSTGTVTDNNTSCQGTSCTGTMVEEVGKVASNFALNSAGTPYGYNFDYGPCTEQDSSDERVYKGKNCYGSKKVELDRVDANGNVVKDSNGNAVKDPYYLAVFYNGTTPQFLIRDIQTGVIKGLTDAEPTSAQVAVDQYLDWIQYDSSGSTVPNGAGVYQVFFQPLTYVTGYEYNQNDPTPHYTANTALDSSNPLVGSEGTFLAGIVAAMRNPSDANLQTYGVAYDAAILPINKDVIGINANAVSAIVNNGAQVALLNEAYANIVAGQQDATGMFTKNEDNTYSSRAIADVLGGDRAIAYKMFGDNNVVAVVPNGNAQNTSYAFSQPALQSAVPLASNFNGATSWNPSSTVLPTVSKTNPLYHLYLTVGAIEEPVTSSTGSGNVTYNLAPYSQPCGVAASYCLVAPGGQSAENGLYSTLDPKIAGSSSGYAYNTSFGTGASAAVVSGAVAVLMGAYPHLSAQEVVEILLRTATYIKLEDIGDTAQKAAYSTGYKTQYDANLEHYYNNIFGYGLVNLDAATQPVGGKNGLWVHKDGKSSVGDSTIVTVASTSLVTPATISGSLTSSLSSSLPATFTAFDAYNRPFAYDTASLFNMQNRRKTKSWNDFKMFMSGREPVVVEPTENFSMMYREQTRRVSSSSQIPLGLMQINLKRDKMRYSLFYSQDTTMGKEAYWKRRQVNPFIQMRDAYGLETAYQFNPKWSIEVGWTMGRNGFFDEEDSTFDTPDNKMQAFSSAVVFKPVDKLSFKVETGIMKETGSSLGLVSSGAFNIKGGNTHFVGAGVAFTPMDKIRLEAMYYYGQTKTSSDGGLMNLSRLSSDSFALTASYEPDENNLFGLQLSSPLRVRKGTLNVTLPVGRHPTEDIYYYDTYQADMKPKARELDLSMYYQGHVTEEVSLQSELGVRLNPDHQADVAPDYRGMVGVKWKY